MLISNAGAPTLSLGVCNGQIKKTEVPDALKIGNPVFAMPFPVGRDLDLVVLIWQKAVTQKRREREREGGEGKHPED